MKEPEEEEGSAEQNRDKYVTQMPPLTLTLQNHRCLSLTSSTTANMCVFVRTGYEERGLQSNFGPSEATADTLVGPRVPGLDLRDEQRAVG